MNNLWRSLEEIAGPAAVRATWSQWVGTEFEAVRAAFLRRANYRAPAIPCASVCGCEHDVVEHQDGTLVGVCTCDPWKCENIELMPEDVVVWELDWRKLGRALARAFGCEAKDGELGVPGAVQVAALGSSLPVVLTIQQEGDEFRGVIGQLVARLRENFVVLAPTGRFMDAHCHGLLKSAKAGFFDLETHVELLDSRKLHAPVSGSVLFKAHLPAKAEGVSEPELARVFRLFGELLAMGTHLKAAPARVFDLMIFKKLTKAETAVACKCAASLITKRAELIENHFRMPIGKLLAFASDLKERQRSVKGDRYAKKRQGAVHEDLEEPDGEGAAASKEEYRYEEGSADD